MDVDSGAEQQLEVEPGSEQLMAVGPGAEQPLEEEPGLGQPFKTEHAAEEANHDTQVHCAGEPSHTDLKSEQGASDEVTHDVAIAVNGDSLQEGPAPHEEAKHHAAEDIPKVENGDVSLPGNESLEKAKEQGRERARDKDRGRDRNRDRDERSKDKDRGKEKSKTRDKEKERAKDSKDKKDRRRSRSRSRSKSRDRRRDRRSRSREARKRSRSRSRERRRARRSRSKSKERRSYRKSRSRSPSRSRHSKSKGGRRRSRSNSADYGGYVPRKRQEPPKPLASSASNDPVATYKSAPAAVSTQNQEEALRLWQEQQLVSRQLVLQQQAASAAAAVSKTQREVYVGNLTPGLVTEAALRQLFNSALAAAYPGANVPGMEPVVNVSMHSDGRYAFVELRSPEMGTAALTLSGQVSLLGQPISVGRPSGYVDPAKAQAAAQAAAQALAAFSAGNTSVAASLLGVSPVLSSGLRSVSPAVTSPQAAAMIQPAMGLLFPTQPQTLPSIGVPTSDTPTSYVVVKGLVKAEFLADDQEYSDVVDELKEECMKYGTVTAVKVPRPDDPSTAYAVIDTQYYGLAFVEFQEVADAVMAQKAIHGRLYAGQVVQAAYITKDLFDHV